MKYDSQESFFPNFMALEHYFNWHVCILHEFPAVKALGHNKPKDVFPSWPLGSGISSSIFYFLFYCLFYLASFRWLKEHCELCLCLPDHWCHPVKKHRLWLFDKSRAQPLFSRLSHPWQFLSTRINGKDHIYFSLARIDLGAKTVCKRFVIHRSRILSEGEKVDVHPAHFQFIKCCNVGKPS